MEDTVQNNRKNIIQEYGVKLKLLTANDLELVRRWRNDPKIVRFMEFRDYITEEMQIKWFEKISNRHHFFYIVEFEDKDIALANIKNVDFEHKTGEGGLFIWDDNYTDSIISYKITYALYDFAFENLGLSQIECHVLQDNKRAIDYNKSLGFKLQPNQDIILNQLYKLTKDDYNTKKNRFLKYIINS
ncbi:MAG: GNAT family N-acetyltransferase [Bacteroidales bacterium]|jgi:RimJ/RimL family protein N-acetyltransferase